MSQENVEVVRGFRIVLPSHGDGVSERRSLDERLSIRFPAVYRLLGGAFVRLPPRSRLRRLLITRRLWQAYAAANRRDFDSVLIGWDPESEYQPSADLIAPDQDAVFYGHDGYLQLWRYWLAAFEDIRWDPEEILYFGDRLVVTTQQRGRGSGSGVGVSKPVFQLFTLRRGLVIRQEDFADRDQALEAAGLSE
ncbi:MAG TPA: nuclear transport factor 2 family protein [Solirubrobacterales bacterium]|nr:nuclear transport factor 2 family protein [Solirubrobacterales bacterium]